MPEQPQWPERTLDMPPQDPWADPPTTDLPPRRQPPPERGYDPNERAYDPTRQSQGERNYDPTRQWGEQSAAPPFQGSARSGMPPAGAPAVQGPARPAGAPQGTAGAAQTQGSARPPAQAPGEPQQNPAWSGRAAVNPRPQSQQFAAEHEPTGTGWPGAEPHQERRPLEWHLAQLRRGGEWSFAGLLFAFVCWGIWALSTGGSLPTAIVVFIVSLLVAAGVFALSRLIGRVVWERQLGRERRTAKGAHIVAGLFLVGVGIAHLQQTPWVMDAVHWIGDLFN
ncbi:DUF4405 domain-containing protein [Actinoplanes sp. TFC3]|uniref:DUF4405 domain-containing protein n=1 Tax=Actinoplanes sp. TFC3 TaxID=1710355 RepID=UPI00083741DE